MTATPKEQSLLAELGREREARQRAESMLADAVRRIAGLQRQLTELRVYMQQVEPVAYWPTPALPVNVAAEEVPLFGEVFG